MRQQSFQSGKKDGRQRYHHLCLWDKTARFEEIARMLAGEHITDEARAAARVLLTA